MKLHVELAISYPWKNIQKLVMYVNFVLLKIKNKLYYPVFEIQQRYYRINIG
jgi:hypothetical protein